METVLDIAFVIAVVAFFKKQFALEGWKTIAVAAVASMFAAFAPLLVSQFPAISPYVGAFINGLTMLLAAAGGVDFVNSLRKSQ